MTYDELLDICKNYADDHNMNCFSRVRPSLPFCANGVSEKKTNLNQKKLPFLCGTWTVSGVGDDIKMVGYVNLNKGKDKNMEKAKVTLEGAVFEQFKALFIIDGSNACFRKGVQQNTKGYAKGSEHFNALKKKMVKIIHVALDISDKFDQKVGRRSIIETSCSDFSGSRGYSGQKAQITFICRQNDEGNKIFDVDDIEKNYVDRSGCKQAKNWQITHDKWGEISAFTSEISKIKWYLDVNGQRIMTLTGHKKDSDSGEKFAFSERKVMKNKIEDDFKCPWSRVCVNEIFLTPPSSTSASTSTPLSSPRDGEETN